MIITSKFKWFFYLTRGWILFIFSILMLSTYALDKRYYYSPAHNLVVHNKPFPISQVIFLNILCIVFIIKIISLIVKEIYITAINTSANTITFKTALTGSTQSFQLNYFDGYIYTLYSNNLGTYKVYYLVKDKELVKKISGRYYSNIDELAQGLQSVPYKGFHNWYALHPLYRVFKKPVLD